MMRRANLGHLAFLRAASLTMLFLPTRVSGTDVEVQQFGHVRQREGFNRRDFVAYCLGL
jgi:hypothetical protein